MKLRTWWWQSGENERTIMFWWLRSLLHWGSTTCFSVQWRRLWRHSDSALSQAFSFFWLSTLTRKWKMKTLRCSLMSSLRLPGFPCSISSTFTAFLTSLEFKKEIGGRYIREDGHLLNYKLLCYHNWIQLSLLIWSHGSEEPNGKRFRQNE